MTTISSQATPTPAPTATEQTATHEAVVTRLGLQALDDGALAAVLRRVSPCPGLVATSSALAARTSHLTCQINGARVDLPKPDKVREYTATWRANMKDVDVPKQVARLPLWCRSRAAETFFDGLAAQPQITLQRVCKRWRRVMEACVPVTTVLGSASTRPPATTEALLVAYDWNAVDENVPQGDQMIASGSPDHLQQLASLASLRTLIVWNTFQRTTERSDDRTAHFYHLNEHIKAPPPLPQPLGALQHLVYFVPQHEGPLDEGSSERFAASVVHLSNLKTLVLPQGLTPARHGGNIMLRRLSTLKTLIAPQITEVGLEHATPKRFAALRRLTASAPLAQVEATEDGAMAELARHSEGAAGDVEGSSGMLMKKPSSSNRALKSVTLERVPWAMHRASHEGALPRSVEELCAADAKLKRLTLAVWDYRYTVATIESIAAARSLKCFELRECAHLEQPVPFDAFESLRKLYMPIDAPLTEESLANLASLITLEALTMRVGQTGGLSALFSRVSALKIIKLCKSALNEADCYAIASLSRLESLCIEACTFTDPTALSALRCLFTLRELVLRSCTGVLESALIQLDPGAAFPRLNLLEISNVRARSPQLVITADFAAALSQLSVLQDLSFWWCQLGDDALRALGDLRDLRRLDIRYTTGWSTAALPGLRCPKLLVVDARGTSREPFPTMPGAEEPAAPLPHTHFTLLSSYPL